LAAPTIGEAVAWLRHQKNSPYLDKPLRPLADVLPRVLEEIELELPRGRNQASDRGSRNEPS
jgi:hypothetical protein